MGYNNIIGEYLFSRSFMSLERYKKLISTKLAELKEEKNDALKIKLEEANVLLNRKNGLEEAQPKESKAQSKLLDSYNEYFKTCLSARSQGELKKADEDLKMALEIYKKERPKEFKDKRRASPENYQDYFTRLEKQVKAFVRDISESKTITELKEYIYKLDLLAVKYKNINSPVKNPLNSEKQFQEVINSLSNDFEPPRTDKLIELANMIDSFPHDTIIYHISSDIFREVVENKNGSYTVDRINGLMFLLKPLSEYTMEKLYNIDKNQFLADLTFSLIQNQDIDRMRLTTTLDGILERVNNAKVTFQEADEMWKLGDDLLVRFELGLEKKNLGIFSRALNYEGIASPQVLNAAHELCALIPPNHTLKEEADDKEEPERNDLVSSIFDKNGNLHHDVLTDLNLPASFHKPFEKLLQNYTNLTYKEAQNLFEDKEERKKIDLFLGKAFKVTTEEQKGTYKLPQDLREYKKGTYFEIDHESKSDRLERAEDQFGKDDVIDALTSGVALKISESFLDSAKMSNVDMAVAGRVLQKMQNQGKIYETLVEGINAISDQKYDEKIIYNPLPMEQVLIQPVVQRILTAGETVKQALRQNICQDTGATRHLVRLANTVLNLTPDSDLQSFGKELLAQQQSIFIEDNGQIKKLDTEEKLIEDLILRETIFLECTKIREKARELKEKNNHVEARYLDDLVARAINLSKSLFKEPNQMQMTALKDLLVNIRKNKKSDIESQQDFYKSLLLTDNWFKLFSAVTKITGLRFTVAPTEESKPVPEQEAVPEGRMPRLYRKYQNVPVAARVAAIVFLALFVGAAIALAVFAPPTLIFTLPFIGEITTSALTLVVVASSMAGAVLAGHGLHIGIKEPKEAPKVEREVFAEPVKEKVQKEIEKTQSEKKKENQKESQKEKVTNPMKDPIERTSTSQIYRGVLDKLQERKLTPEEYKAKEKAKDLQLEAKTKAEAFYIEACALYSNWKPTIEEFDPTIRELKEVDAKINGYQIISNGKTCSLHYIDNNKVTNIALEGELKNIPAEEKLTSSEVRKIEENIQKYFYFHRKSALDIALSRDKIANEMEKEVSEKTTLYERVECIEKWAKIGDESLQKEDYHTASIIKYQLSQLFLRFPITKRYISDSVAKFQDDPRLHVSSEKSSTNKILKDEAVFIPYLFEISGAFSRGFIERRTIIKANIKNLKEEITLKTMEKTVDHDVLSSLETKKATQEKLLADLDADFNKQLNVLNSKLSTIKVPEKQTDLSPKTHEQSGLIQQRKVETLDRKEVAKSVLDKEPYIIKYSLPPSKPPKGIADKKIIYVFNVKHPFLGFSIKFAMLEGNKYKEETYTPSDKSILKGKSILDKVNISELIEVIQNQKKIVIVNPTKIEHINLTQKYLWSTTDSSEQPAPVSMASDYYSSTSSSSAYSSSSSSSSSAYSPSSSGSPVSVSVPDSPIPQSPTSSTSSPIVPFSPDGSTGESTSSSDLGPRKIKT